MNPQDPRLVVVAYAMDETLFFSEVCRGADIVAVTSRYEDICQDKLAQDFREAGAALGARQTFYLGLPDQDPFPEEELAGQLESLGSYQRVYTHSPLDDDSFRVYVASTTSKVFRKVWVQAIGSPASEAHVLSRDRFLRKVEIMNRHYCEHIHPQDGSLSHGSLAEVESFVEAGHNEVLSAMAVNTGDILDHSNPWGFKTSAYERTRFATTCQLLADHVGRSSITEILEVGACEGEMTALLRATFPGARIHALESHPLYGENLQRRFREDEHVTVIKSSAVDVPLDAEVVVLAEVLYYIDEDDLPKVLKKLRAKYLVIVEGGNFDLEVQQELKALGWHQLAYRRVSSRFDPVDGENSNIISFRSGTNVRLWGREEAASS
jgi:hypothetical protein